MVGGAHSVSLVHPSATVPALQQLGVVHGPHHVQGVIQRFAAVLGRVLDWVRRRLRREPGPEVRPDAEEAEAAPGVALAEASELQLGVAAAARHIRDKGLPPGQP